MIETKTITTYKQGKEPEVKQETCNPLRLEPASKYIDNIWYECIKEVFSYQKERGADLQEVHKLFLDDRIERGVKLVSEKAILELVKTDVDIRANVKSTRGAEVITMKNWKPEIIPRRNFEISRYIEQLFYDCSCTDHMMGHYRSNSALCCKHIAAVMWWLQQQDEMPKFIVTPIQKTTGFKKSIPDELATRINALSMKKFETWLNILMLQEYKGIKPSLSFSLHRKYYKDYGGMEMPVVWSTFTEPEQVERVLRATLEGYKIMLKERGYTDEEVKQMSERILVEDTTLRFSITDDVNINLAEDFDYDIPIEQPEEEPEEKKEGIFKTIIRRIFGL